MKSIHMSAEHGVITPEAPNGEAREGDARNFVVGYGDATIFLHDRLYGVRTGTVETVWTVQGRDRVVTVAG